MHIGGSFPRECPGVEQTKASKCQNFRKRKKKTLKGIAVCFEYELAWWCTPAYFKESLLFRDGISYILLHKKPFLLEA